MTLQQFNTTLFSSKTKVMYEGKKYKIHGIDFYYASIGIAKKVPGGLDITWINYTECEIVKK